MSLHYLIRKRYLPGIRQAVESGFGVNSKDTNRRTPLMLCCMDDNEQWAVGVIRMLLQAGAKPGLRDKDDRTALMYSCIFDRYEACKLFLKAIDFDLLGRDRFGNTALHYAVQSDNAEMAAAVMRVMHQHDLRLNTRNILGHTAASLAVCSSSQACLHLFVGQGPVVMPRVKRNMKRLMSRLPEWTLSAIENPRDLRHAIVRDVQDTMRQMREKVNLRHAYVTSPDVGHAMTHERAEERAKNRIVQRQMRRIRHFRRQPPLDAVPRAPAPKETPASVPLVTPQRDKSAAPRRNTTCQHQRARSLFVKFNEDTRKPDVSNSWREVMPGMLDLLKVQVSESYRAPAVVPLPSQRSSRLSLSVPSSENGEPSELDSVDFAANKSAGRRRSSVIGELPAFPGGVPRGRSKSIAVADAQLIRDQLTKPSRRGRRDSVMALQSDSAPALGARRKSVQPKAAAAFPPAGDKPQPEGGDGRRSATAARSKQQAKELLSIVEEID